MPLFSRAVLARDRSPGTVGRRQSSRERLGGLARASASSAGKTFGVTDLLKRGWTETGVAMGHGSSALAVVAMPAVASCTL